MKLARWFLVIFALYLLGYVSHALYLNKTVYGDGVFYYSWLRSAVLDHDIDFRNEYNIFHLSHPPAPSGLPGNKYSIGPPLLWATDFVWTHLLSRKTGYEFNYQFFVGLDGVLAAIVGLVFLFRLLTTFFPPSISILTAVVVAFATNLFFYGSLDTVNSHAASFLAATIFLNILLIGKKQWFLIGVTLGIVGLMRTQDLIYAFALVPYWKKLSMKALATGFLIGFSPQLIAWQALYGKFWMSPYLSQYEGFNFWEPHILEVLFSYHNGLFFWTPILALGLVGLWVSKFNVWLKAIVFLQIFLVSTWSTWWQGASYSGRMFVSVLPIFALGIAHVFAWLWKKGWRESYFFSIFILPLSLLNMLLIVYFLLIT